MPQPERPSRRSEKRAAGGLPATEMNWKDFCQADAGSLASAQIMNEVAGRTKEAAAATARAICKKHDNLLTRIFSGQHSLFFRP